MLNNVDLFIWLCLVFIVIGITVILNAIYFQIRYQKRLDQLLHGDDYIDGGWIFNSQRMMMYAHYCLFEKRARRAGLYDQVQAIPGVIKGHLLLHWVLVILGGFLMLLLWLFDYFYMK